MPPKPGAKTKVKTEGVTVKPIVPGKYAGALKWGVLAAGLMLLLVLNFGLNADNTPMDIVRMNIMFLMVLAVIFIMTGYITRESRPGDKLEITAVVTLIGFMGAAFYAYCANLYWPDKFPGNTFLFSPDDKFMDFINYYKGLALKEANAYTYYASSPNNYIYSLLSAWFGGRYYSAYTVYALVFVLYVFGYVYLSVKKSAAEKGNNALINIIIITFLTYPFLINIDRGNPEMLIFILLSLSVAAFIAERYLTSVILLAVIILTQKVYFAAFILMFLHKNRYREILLFALFIILGSQLAILADRALYPGTNIGLMKFNPAVAAGAAAMIAAVIALWRFAASKAWQPAAKKIIEAWNRPGTKKIAFITLAAAAVVACVIIWKPVYTAVYNNYLSPGQPYNANYVIEDGGAAHCSSLYGAIKEIIIKRNIPVSVRTLFAVYPYLALLLLAAIIYYIFFLKEAMWKKVMAVIITILMLPFVTGDYRLIHLLIPLTLFLRSEEKGGFDVWYALLFGLLLIPGKYYILRGWVGEGTITHPLLLLTFLLLMLYEGIYKKRAGKAGRPA